MARRNVPPKLERYLLTIARRGSIENISVSVVAVLDGSIVLHENRLPTAAVGPDGIDAALGKVLGKMEITSRARYVGHIDRGKTQRQYNFVVMLDEKPPLDLGFSLQYASEAANMLDHKDAKLVSGSFPRPQAIGQMLVW